MAKASTLAVGSWELKASPELTFRLGPYEYDLQAKDGDVVFSVSDGTQRTTKDLKWAVGDGLYGQTYVYREQGKYYESELSFYRRLNGLDMTTGHMEPKSLETAAGDLTTPAMIRQCFGCHFTAATTKDHFDPDGATPGVTCEACHGPGARHVQAESSAGAEDADPKQLIMNPAKLDAVDLVDFCGACHRNPADAVLTGVAHKGIVDVRLQPYRLEKSKCWGKGDARLTCIACHDPHVQVISDAGFYDQKCLRCHAVGSNARLAAPGSAPACKVATKNCVTCHMPKVEVAGAHATFTDHDIRIVRSGTPYPD